MTFLTKVFIIFIIFVRKHNNFGEINIKYLLEKVDLNLVLFYRKDKDTV